MSTFTAVHQFHSGTSVGDAITNELLELRRVLRGAGLASEIFAEHVGPGLESEIRPLADYRGDAARPCCWSTTRWGSTASTASRALPDRKVLRYHNITPPHFFAHPHLRSYAEKGRLQLREYRRHVEFALRGLRVQSPRAGPRRLQIHRRIADLLQCRRVPRHPRRPGGAAGGRLDGARSCSSAASRATNARSIWSALPPAAGDSTRRCGWFWLARGSTATATSTRFATRSVPAAWTTRSSWSGRVDAGSARRLLPFQRRLRLRERARGLRRPAAGGDGQRPADRRVPRRRRARHARRCGSAPRRQGSLALGRGHQRLCGAMPRRRDASVLAAQRRRLADFSVERTGANLRRADRHARPRAAAPRQLRARRCRSRVRSRPRTASPRSTAIWREALDAEGDVRRLDPLHRGTGRLHPGASATGRQAARRVAVAQIGAARHAHPTSSSATSTRRASATAPDGPTTCISTGRTRAFRPNGWPPSTQSLDGVLAPSTHVEQRPARIGRHRADSSGAGRRRRAAHRRADAAAARVADAVVPLSQHRQRLSAQGHRRAAARRISPSSAARTTSA